MATLFIGEKIMAPGTMGSFLGLFWYTLFFYGDHFIIFWLKFIASAYVAMVICGEAEFRLGKKDPGCVILDEMVAMPLCFIAIGGLRKRLSMWIILLSGFLLFRFFDIVKPFGIKRLQNFHGGIGIVIDDLLAAIYTACTLLFAGELLS
ncbi:MAG: phosphatidylglycerophosphatase A [Puniceicoccales bacterium]|nr:phosphatidylglycerophosphatase A [Puniceicoccales bacterium]